MKRASDKLAFQFTFLFRREGSQWSALACEVDAASCGKTLRDAREALQEAVALYVSYLLENGMRDQIARPVPQEAKDEFIGEATGRAQVERHTMIAAPHPTGSGKEVEAEFVPTELQSTLCHLLGASLQA